MNILRNLVLKDLKLNDLKQLAKEKAEAIYEKQYDELEHEYQIYKRDLQSIIDRNKDKIQKQKEELLKRQQLEQQERERQKQLEKQRPQNKVPQPQQKFQNQI